MRLILLVLSCFPIPLSLSLLSPSHPSFLEPDHRDNCKGMLIQWDEGIFKRNSDLRNKSTYHSCGTHTHTHTQSYFRLAIPDLHNSKMSLNGMQMRDKVGTNESKCSMMRTYFHVFIPKSLCLQQRRPGRFCRAADETAAVCFQGGGALSAIKHLNKNSKGEGKSSQFAVKYHSVLPPYRINI